MKHPLCFDDISSLISYDPDTGTMRWKSATPELFSSGVRHSAETRCNIWNAKYSGKPALQHRDKDRPYAYGDILGRKYYAHRVAAMIMTGEWPQSVDHINGDKSDNRWSNLQPTTAQGNAMNSPRRSDNSSGVPGVYWDKSRGLWAAEIMFCGKKAFLGRFGTKEDAARARKRAQEQYGFSDRHGRL